MYTYATELLDLHFDNDRNMYASKVRLFNRMRRLDLTAITATAAHTFAVRYIPQVRRAEGDRFDASEVDWTEFASGLTEEYTEWRAYND